MQDKAHIFLRFRIILNALERSRSRKRVFKKELITTTLYMTATGQKWLRGDFGLNLKYRLKFQLYHSWKWHGKMYSTSNFLSFKEGSSRYYCLTPPKSHKLLLKISYIIKRMNNYKTCAWNHACLKMWTGRETREIMVWFCSQRYPSQWEGCKIRITEDWKLSPSVVLKQHWP